MSPCHTCELIQRRDAGNAPDWDCIHRTPYWDVVHSYNTTLPGWLVLVARRHITSIAELTEAEAAEFGPLMRQVSLILQDLTGCAKTYVMQFAEQADHPHVHFHIVPRMPDLPADCRGPNIFKYLGVQEPLTEEAMNQLALQIRARLLENYRL